MIQTSFLTDEERQELEALRSLVADLWELADDYNCLGYSEGHWEVARAIMNRIQEHDERND